MNIEGRVFYDSRCMLTVNYTQITCLREPKKYPMKTSGNEMPIHMHSSATIVPNGTCAVTQQLSVSIKTPQHLVPLSDHYTWKITELKAKIPVKPHHRSVQEWHEWRSQQSLTFHLTLNKVFEKLKIQSNHEIEKQLWCRNQKLNRIQQFAKRVKTDFGDFREISVTW